MVYDDVLFSVWHELFFTQICNPPGEFESKFPEEILGEETFPENFLV